MKGKPKLNKKKQSKKNTQTKSKKLNLQRNQKMIKKMMLYQISRQEEEMVKVRVNLQII